MKHEHFVVQSPATPAAQLILLFHGVGDNPVAMGEIGSYFAKDFPQAQVVSIGGPEAFGNGAGRQWFSVRREPCGPHRRRDAAVCGGGASLAATERRRLCRHGAGGVLAGGDHGA